MITLLCLLIMTSLICSGTDEHIFISVFPTDISSNFFFSKAKQKQKQNWRSNVSFNMEQNVLYILRLIWKRVGSVVHLHAWG